jgi:hypothetical protein
LNSTESEIGCLYAGIPQGSVLKPMLFLIYINDIADHTDGICRLFADDTSLGHSNNDLQNFQDMINSDLSNIKKWSEDWLITFNPDTTDIMLFDSRRQGNLNFKFGQTNILSRRADSQFNYFSACGIFKNPREIMVNIFR